jgi:hypothetical protein
MAEPDAAVLLRIIEAWARAEARVRLLNDWIEKGVLPGDPQGH